MATLIKIRRGDAATWASVNPVLAEGEQGYDLTNERTKIGDGVTAWEDLPFTDEVALGVAAADATAKANAAQSAAESTAAADATSKASAAQSAAISAAASDATSKANAAQSAAISAAASDATTKANAAQSAAISAAASDATTKANAAQSAAATDATTKANAAQAAAIQRGNHTGTQAQSTVVDLVTDLAAKVAAANPVITGSVTAAPTAVAGGVIDITKPANSATITDSTTVFTLSATPAAGRYTKLVVSNTDDEAHFFTIPSMFSEAQDGAAITEVYVAAESELTVVIEGRASGTWLIGDTASELPAQVSGGEKTAGTETALRSYSPADIVDMIDEHAPAGGGSIDDTAFGGSWNGVTDEAPSKNAVFDMVDTDDTLAADSDSLVPSQQAVKAYVDANAVAIPAGFYLQVATDSLGSLPAGWLVADGTEGTLDKSADSPAGLTYVMRGPGLPPVFVSAEINVDGDEIEIVFNEDVNGSGGGFTISASGGAATLTYVSGDGSDTLVYSISRTILDDETVTISYAGGNWEDNQGNALGSFTGEAVTNSSEETGGSSVPSYVGAASNGFSGTASPTVNYPTVIANDIMLMAVATDNNHSSSGTPPTGWTKIDQEDSGGVNSTMSLFWKRAGGSEPGSESWTSIFGSSESGIAVVVAYRGCTTSGSPIDVTDNSGASTGTSHSQAVVTTVANTRVVGFMGTDPSNNPTSFDWTSPIVERVDSGTTPSGQNNLLGYIAVGDTDAVSTGSVTMGGTASETISMVRFAVALKP